MRVLRERAERAEQRARDLEAARQPQPQQQAHDDFDVADDSLIEGKDLKKYYRKISEENKQIKDQLAQFTSVSAETRLRSKHADFDKYVTDDNIRKLAEQKPSMYRSIMANPDLYDKGDVAYEAIKSMMPDAPDYADQDKKLAANKAKPRSASIAGAPAAETPLARFGEYDRRVLTDQQKQEIRDRLDRLKQQG